MEEEEVLVGFVVEEGEEVEGVVEEEVEEEVEGDDEGDDEEDEDENRFKEFDRRRETS